MASKPPKGRPGNEEVRDQTVRMDYQTFERKSFIDCKLVYAGGDPPTLIDCDFIQCSWTFEGPALNTARFMAAMSQSSEGGKDLILSILRIK
tara:strand:- start:578 stop:853 length:276 start_codon:yes stop_codon:yes gene_type:complete